MRTLPDMSPKRPFAHLDALDCRPAGADFWQRVFWRLAPMALVVFAIVLVAA